MKTTFRVLIPAYIFIFILYILMLSPAISQAHAESGTFIVNANDDRGDAEPGDGMCKTIDDTCTLRAVIIEANVHPGEDMIVLPNGTYILTITGTGENQSVTGDLDITEAVSILGDSSVSTVIDASLLGDRAIEILASANPVSISNLSINGVNIPGSIGGGICSAFDVTLIPNTVLYENTHWEITMG
jgi:hypothetical protein